MHEVSTATLVGMWQRYIDGNAAENQGKATEFHSSWTAVTLTTVPHNTHTAVQGGS